MITISIIFLDPQCPLSAYQWSLWLRTYNSDQSYTKDNRFYQRPYVVHWYERIRKLVEAAICNIVNVVGVEPKYTERVGLNYEPWQQERSVLYPWKDNVSPRRRPMGAAFFSHFSTLLGFISFDKLRTRNSPEITLLSFENGSIPSF